MSERVATKPTHRLMVRVRNEDGSVGEQRGHIGSGWLNADRSVTIKLHAGASLRWTDPVMINLFPIDEKER